MKVKIIGKPEFEIALSKAQLEALIMCSEHHYDGTCKAASRFGGFIYGWNDMLLPPDPAKTVMASWKQLDTCLKIFEVASSISFTVAEKYKILDFRVSATKALEEAGKIYESKAWTMEVE